MKKRRVFVSFIIFFSVTFFVINSPIDVFAAQKCNSLLGSTTDENSVAWLLQQILNYLKVLGPLLVLILSSIDFAKAIIVSDDETMKKAQKKLITRLLAVVILFFIPDLVSLLLQIFGITDDPTCGLG